MSLSKIEIFGPRYFLDLPSQHVSERVVFGPFAVTRGRKLLETFLDLQIFSVPQRDFCSRTSKELACGLGGGQEHHNAGVSRHLIQRILSRSWAVMATGAFSSPLAALPMATEKIPEKRGSVMWMTRKQRNRHDAH